MSVASAFAPASVGNVAVGFDLLGLALDGVGDRVSVRRIARPTVELESIDGVVPELPHDPAANTASVPLIALRERYGIRDGFSVSLSKGIPLGSGMGGSAASAVAAVVAANALLDEPLATPVLLELALAGEAVASGASHPDNAAASLLGGLVLLLPDGSPQRIPVPHGLACVLVHPHVEVTTRAARAMLAPSYPLSAFVTQSAHLAGFILGCCANDAELVRRCLRDTLIEPQRACLVPGFDEVREAALAAGALGSSISGAGPSVFAWVARDHAQAVEASMRKAFRSRDVECDSWVSSLDAPGAYVLAEV